jgi:hypothetical protein
MTAPQDTYTAESHDASGKVNEVTGLSYDAARHLAQTHRGMGFTARIVAEQQRYAEVWDRDGHYVVSEDTLAEFKRLMGVE